MTHTILLVDDEPVQRRLMSALLSKKLSYQVMAVDSGEEALRRLRASNIGDLSAVLLDIHMPGMNGFETLAQMRRLRPDLPVLMLTGSDDTELAVRAIKEGASDFIVKPPQPAHLGVAIENAIRLSTLSQELARLRQAKESGSRFSDLIGYQGSLAGTVAYARKAAASDVPVLLAGESGVGKELLARTIHHESRRSGLPFVAVNCSAVSQGIETLLFGTAQQPGRIRAADGGTLFLDDISALAPEAQVRLLRLVQQRELEQAAGSKPVRVNVRMIVATDRDLRREVQAGRFREDLYFRLNVLPITLPPLRDRAQDVVPLALHFIDRISLSDRLPLKTLSEDAIDYLSHHRWPGNVRELEGLIHRALVLAESDQIDRRLLEAMHEASTPSESLSASSFLAPLHVALRRMDGSFKSMEEVEYEVLKAVLAQMSGNVTRAADVLGLAKSTFYRKLKENGDA